MAAPAKSLPKDAQVMSAILKDMGVLDHEPRLINQMLEFSYRYVTDVLDDAKVYSSHASKKTIDTDDVRLAVQCKMDHSFTSPPPRDLLIEVARHKNSQSMPLIKPYSGPRLPPDRYCLSAPNFKLAHKKKPPRIQFGLPVNQFGGGSRISLTQIPKQPGKMPLGGIPQPQKGLPVGNVTVINRPTQPRPLVRVQQGPGSGASLLSMPHNPPNLQSLPPPNIPGQFQNPPYIPGVVNPLKRKLEDEDYDHT